MSLEKLGTDEWVARSTERKLRPTGLRLVAQVLGQRLPLWARLGGLLAIGLAVPLATDNAYIIRVAGTVVLMSTLALALNVVVGYAGLLDLGFVAFYGIGGYAYAYLSSGFTGLHWPSWASLLFITLLTALFGLLLGSPSLRLTGDYLAIVTLGFGQIFVQLATSLTRVHVPWSDRPVDLTGGPNGIVNLDPLSLGGLQATSPAHYYYILLVLLILVLVVIFFLNYSRIGRAWRSMREDELAAEAMGMPTRRLKLLAFSIGAGIAGLTGAIFAAWQRSVFPGNFDVTLLITLYAMVVLGGLGSLPGVVMGAVILATVPEILRSPDVAGVVFYGAVVLTVLVALRPRWKSAALLAALAVFGFALKAAILQFWPDSMAVFPLTRSIIGDAIRDWLAIPVEATLPGNLAFFAAVIMIGVVIRLRHEWWRFVALIPTLYLLAFVWETRLSKEPSVTRLLLVGAMLVALMMYRPHGLLGQPRVEVV